LSRTQRLAAGCILVITDRSGGERQIIGMTQDTHDPCKWRLDAPFELAAYERAHTFRDGSTQGIPYADGPTPSTNTIFLPLD
jgi:hypothetical protein